MSSYSNYILDDEFELVKADHREFAIHYSTYRENIFFRQSWEKRISIFDEESPLYWIFHRGHRIGGVSIEPNELSSLFLQPPSIDLYLVMLKMKQLLLNISDLSKPIRVSGILPYQTEHFLRLGFLPSESRRVMMRPTELFELQELANELELITPTSEHIERISELLFDSYSGPDSIGYPGENSIGHHRLALKHYFENNDIDSLKAASLQGQKYVKAATLGAIVEKY